MKSDEQLMASVQDGKLDRLAVLFDRYHQPLFKYCVAITGSPHVAEDCVQEAFRRILQYRHSYRDGVFKLWLYRIARNVAMDLLPERAAPEQADMPDESPGPEIRALNAEHADLIRDALLRIKPSYREVLVLAKFQELGSREIAQITGAGEGAVRVRLHRALRALAGELSIIELAGD